MQLETLKEHFADGEYPDATHVVVTSTETGRRSEIEDVWVDGDGILNIITTERPAGNMDGALMQVVFSESDD